MSRYLLSVRGTEQARYVEKGNLGELAKFRKWGNIRNYTVHYIEI